MSLAPKKLLLAILSEQVSLVFPPLRMSSFHLHSEGYFDWVTNSGLAVLLWHLENVLPSLGAPCLMMRNPQSLKFVSPVGNALCFSGCLPDFVFVFHF